MRITTRDILISIVLILISIVVILISMNFKGDAGFFPIGLSILLIISSLFVVVSSIRENKGKQREEKSNSLNYPRFYIFSILIISLFLLAKTLGFFIVIPVFLFLSIRLLSEIKTSYIFIISIVFTFVLYIVFVVFLGIPVPEGLLENFL